MRTARGNWPTPQGRNRRTTGPDRRKLRILRENQGLRSAGDCQFPSPCSCGLCAPDPYDETDERA